MAALVTPPERATSEVPLFLGNRYRVLEMLGRGGASTVYRGHDLMLGRDVAVKVMAPVEPEHDELRRHEAEMRVLSSLRDPGLVTLFDAGTDPVDGGTRVRAYLVMELMAGETLARRIAAGPIDVRWVARAGLALAGGLAVVHARDVVHRDVKPGNVLLRADDALDGDADHAPERSPVKLADFGIARIAAATRLTMTGAIVGTASYLSPEQAVGGAIGPATDVYALGLVLLECVTGRPAFVGTVAEVAAARLSRDPEVPSAVDAAFATLLRRMTLRDPAARPTAAEVRDELTALLDRDAAAWAPMVAGPHAPGPVVAAGAPVVAAAVDGFPATAGLWAPAASAPAGPAPAGLALDGTDDEPTVLQPPVGAPAPAARHAPRRRVGALVLASALVLGGATAWTATAWQSNARQSSVSATAAALSDGLREDVSSVTSALHAGHLEAAEALLDHATRELSSVRRSGALSEAQLAGFAATLDGAAQLLASARADAAAAAAAAQARLAASTTPSPTPTPTATQAARVAAAAPVARRPAPAAPPPPAGPAHGKGVPGSGKAKGKGPGPGHGGKG